MDRKQKYSYYNIYGFIIAVSGPAIKSFDKEYWRFKIKTSKKVDLYIEQTAAKDLPIKLRQDVKGIYIPFSKKEKKALYEKNINTDWLLYEIEPLISWKTKTFLHCGAVEKDGRAILFPAGGGVGKTTLVTFLLRKGFRYLSDDWLIVGDDGKAYPFLKTIHIFDYNLKDKDLAKRVLGRRRFFVMLKIKFLSLLPKIIPSRFTRIIVDRLMPIFSEDISKVFPKAKVGKISQIKKVFWLLKEKNISAPIIEKANSKTIARKMSYINLLEMNHFFRNYYEYAYDTEVNEEIESRHKNDIKILEKAFKKADIYAVKVPAKMNPAKVFNLIKNHL